MVICYPVAAGTTGWPVRPAGSLAALRPLPGYPSGPPRHPTSGRSAGRSGVVLRYAGMLGGSGFPEAGAAVGEQHPGGADVDRPVVAGGWLLSRRVAGLTPGRSSPLARLGLAWAGRGAARRLVAGLGFLAAAICPAGGLARRRVAAGTFLPRASPGGQPGCCQRGGGGGLALALAVSE